jgi:DNA-binding protein Fis
MPSTDHMNDTRQPIRTTRPSVLIAVAQSDALQSLLAAIQGRDYDVGIVEDMSLEDVECFLIKKVMTRCDGNVSQSAKALGLSRSALYRRMQRYGL